MQSSGSKDEFLKQLQLVLDGIKQTKQRVSGISLTKLKQYHFDYMNTLK